MEFCQARASTLPGFKVTAWKGRQRKQTMEQTNLSWLQQEEQQLQQNTTAYEKLESLQLKDGTMVTFTVDASKKFEEWKDDKGTIKKIIPVLHKGVRKNFWLNVKNPLYRELISLLVKGELDFTVATTGTQKDTVYKLVKEA